MQADTPRRPQSAASNKPPKSPDPDGTDWEVEMRADGDLPAGVPSPPEDQLVFEVPRDSVQHPSRASRRKTDVLAELVELFFSNDFVFVVHDLGLTPLEDQSLRRSLAANAVMRTAKNTLIRRAVGLVGRDALDFTGPCTLVFVTGEPTLVAATLVDSERKGVKIAIVAGLSGRVPLSASMVRDIGSIDPREVLEARLAGMFRSVLQSPVSAAKELLTRPARLVSQLAVKRTH